MEISCQLMPSDLQSINHEARHRCTRNFIMAYRLLTVQPIMRIKIDEPGHQFSVWDAQKWLSPSLEMDTFVNHKSVTQFLNDAAEFTFRGRIGHKHSIIMARRDTGVGLAVFEIGFDGVIKIAHWPVVQLVTTTLPVEYNEHTAIIIGLAGPSDLSMFVVDRIGNDTAMIRYRADAGGSIWIPQRYLNTPRHGNRQHGESDSTQHAVASTTTEVANRDMRFNDERQSRRNRRSRSKVHH